MISIWVNGEQKAFEQGVTIEAMLDACGFECSKIAVAVNTEFVPRSTYHDTCLHDGDRVDVLAPVQGG